jgi:flagellar basal-body rod modification protein FlgD
MSPSMNSIMAAPTPSANNTSQNPAAQAAADPLASESTFLTLLVSQMQNQDPLNPVDSNQFVSQLTAYSQLEQLMAINQNTTPAASAAPSPTTAQTGAGSQTNPVTGN